MTPAFSFTKVHGLGNDFVLIRGELEQHAWLLDPAAVASVCDRRTGIGADGVLLTSGIGASPRMRVFNADGSRPEMCGNGLRCVAQRLFGERNEQLLVIETDAGPHACERIADGTIRVAMRDPDTGDGAYTTLAEISDRIEWTTVNVGNPHVITFDDVEVSEQNLLAPKVESHSVFPHGVNVNFARIRDRSSLDLVVFERGVGWTDACGTGASATAVAAVKAGRVDPEREIEVRLPGGSLWIRYERATNKLSMRGPAVQVFEGTYSIA